MFILVLIGVPVAEVFAFIEVGPAVGWLRRWCCCSGPPCSASRSCACRRARRSSACRWRFRSGARRRARRLDGALGVLAARCSWCRGLSRTRSAVLLLLPPSRALHAAGYRIAMPAGWFASRRRRDALRRANGARRAGPPCAGRAGNAPGGCRVDGGRGRSRRRSTADRPTPRSRRGGGGRTGRPSHPPRRRSRSA